MKGKLAVGRQGAVWSMGRNCKERDSVTRDVENTQWE